MNSKPKILMCPADYFDIKYSINPWMDINAKLDGTQQGQWEKLRQTYLDLGYEVELMKPVDGLPDLVFVDAGVLYKDIFIPSNFRYKERQGESIYFENWFSESGYKIEKIDKEFYFEGHGDNLLAGNKMFFGYGFRTCIEAQNEIRKILEKIGDIDIIPIELIDDRFYHLDTCFCPIDKDNALFFPKALSTKAMKILEKNINLIEIPEFDAFKFACNSAVIDKHFVMPKGGKNVRKVMESRGYNVSEVEMSEFIKAGGACKCLSMIIE